MRRQAFRPNRNVCFTAALLVCWSTTGAIAQAGAAASGNIPKSQQTSEVRVSASTASAVNEDPDLVPLLPAWPKPLLAGPKESDVLFSPRFDRPEASGVAAAYAANKMVWSYVEPGPTFDALRRSTAGQFGAAINNNIATPGNVGAAIDFDGKPIVAPWMRARGSLWNSCASPATLRALKSRVAKQLNAGATAIQWDDAGMQFDASFWGVGDFSAASLRGFQDWVSAKNVAGVTTLITPDQAGKYRDWLSQTQKVVDNTDYIQRNARFPTTPLWRAYLQDTVALCVDDLRRYIKATGGADKALSLNLYTPYPWSSNAFLQPFADYVIGEVAPEHSGFHQVAFMHAWLRSQGQRWAPVFPMADKTQLRQAIMATYAAGGNPVVPWDVYVPAGANNTPESRFFGRPEDFSDLFRFARQQSRWLDGWEPLSRINLAVYQDPANVTAALAQLKRLADFNVPYAVFQPRTLSTQAERRHTPGLNGTYLLGKSKSLPSDPLLLLAEQRDASLKAYASAYDISPDWAVVVKGHPGVAATRVIHIVRKQSESPQPVFKTTISAWALPAATTHHAVLFSTDGTRTDLGRLKPDLQGDLPLSFKAPTDWALLVLQPD